MFSVELIACFALNCGHIGCLCSACLYNLHLIITNKHVDMIFLYLCWKSEKAGGGTRGRERKEERPSSAVCFLFTSSYSAHSLECSGKKRRGSESVDEAPLQPRNTQESDAMHTRRSRIQCSQPVSVTDTAAGIVVKELNSTLERSVT